MGALVSDHAAPLPRRPAGGGCREGRESLDSATTEWVHWYQTTQLVTAGRTGLQLSEGVRGLTCETADWVHWYQTTQLVAAASSVPLPEGSEGHSAITDGSSGITHALDPRNRSVKPVANPSTEWIEWFEGLPSSDVSETRGKRRWWSPWRGSA